jgi:tetratricopeptide (TPR) repeat protein
MMSGAIHVLTRTPRPFKIKTPFLNAGVDGTEFFIGLDQDQARLVMYEGKVSASNEHGSVNLADSEAAVASRDRAPQKEVIVRPLDAVQWALYYPLIISSPLGQEAGTDHPITEILRAAIELYQYGSMSEAMAMLDRIPESGHSPRFFTFRAGLLLSVGRIDDARADIEQALKLESGNSDAFALQAIISVVQNDKEQALALASRAVELNPASSAARLSLSYAQQAHFRIEEALDNVRKAVEIEPQNALAWARLAELHMSTGYLDRALEAAQQAVDLNPRLAKTQTVLGFTYLVQMDTSPAKGAFSRAIELDQADPMPRLGMGLAKIREGDLEAGRIELEIAASLDPANSLVRSYLGKAYFEEKRYALAGTQFDLAKERDPNDPTPWLYDGIMKQTQNQPGEALRDIQKSIELNENRAVYRSRLLLDQDQAARGSSLARIYDNLGFEKRAIVETAKSLALDPSSHSTHRFLSDAYLAIPRHQIARVSELLQAQLLQPINVNPVQPQLAVADLNIITGTAPVRAGFNEFSPLLERNKPQLVASGIVGSRGTVADEAVFSALYDRASVSVGQFHYNTNGFRENNDQKHNIYNAFVQYAVTPRFNVQAELRTRKTEHGDLRSNFDPYDPLALNENYRRSLAQDTARIGARFSPSPNQDFLASVLYTDRQDKQMEQGWDNIAKDQGYQAEGQYLFRASRFNAIAGGGAYYLRAHEQDSFSGTLMFRKERANGYLYTNWNLFRNGTATLGVSHDSYREGSFTFNQPNPKLGLQLDLTPNVRMRLAWFQVAKTALALQQTLEPTQVAGFNQYFDDVNGTRSRRLGIGMDAKNGNNIYSGFEISRRDLDVPTLFAETERITLDRMEKQREHLYRVYLYWLPHPHWAIRGEYQFEKFGRKPSSSDVVDPTPYGIETSSAPLNVNYFNPNGVFAKYTATYVRQHLERNAGPVTDAFFLNDVILGYRLPNRRGIANIEVKNLLDENFFYRNVHFYTSEAISPRFIPGRTIFFRLTLNF